MRKTEKNEKRKKWILALLLAALFLCQLPDGDTPRAFASALTLNLISDRDFYQNEDGRIYFANRKPAKEGGEAGEDSGEYQDITLKLTIAADVDKEEWFDDLHTSLSQNDQFMEWKLEPGEDCDRILIIPASVWTTNESVTVDLLFPILEDKAGNRLTANAVSLKSTDTASAAVTTASNLSVSENGALCLPLAFDAKAPEGSHTTAPEISIQDKGTGQVKQTSTDGNQEFPYYQWTGQLSFDIVVTDPDSGVKEVAVKHTNDMEFTELNLAQDDQNYTAATISYAADTNYFDETLTVRATDNAGNVRTTVYTYQVFNKVPTCDLTVESEGGSAESEPEVGSYVTTPYTYTFSVWALEPKASDTAKLEYVIYDWTENQAVLNTVSSSYGTRTEWEFDNGLWKKELSFTVNPSQSLKSYQLSYNGQELIGRLPEEAGQDALLTVDAEAPTFSVVQSPAEPCKQDDTGRTTDYYQGQVTYAVTVTDNLPINLDTLTGTWLPMGEPAVEKPLEFKLANRLVSGQYAAAATITLEDRESAIHTSNTLKQITLKYQDSAANQMIQGTDEAMDDNGVSITNRFEKQGDNSGSWKYAKNVCVDNQDPVIEITVPAPGDASHRITDNGKTTYYYTKAQRITVTVRDASLDAANTVLKYKWKKADRTEVDASEQMEIPFTNATKVDRVYTCTIDLADGVVISDIQVTAVDFATNSSEDKTYQDNIYVVDTTTPQVTVSYDNNAVQNGWYFKEARILTLTVEELNFDPEQTEINTNGVITKPVWTQVGKGARYQTRVSYIADGDYTLSVRTEDRAGNAATVDYTNGGKSQAPQKFVVDKAVPVLTVTKQPISPNGTHDGMDYYQGDVTYQIAVSDNRKMVLNCIENTWTMLDRPNEKKQLTFTDGAKTKASYTATASLILTDRSTSAGSLGESLKTMDLAYTDLAGNLVSWNYTKNLGNPVRVDKIDPAIAITAPTAESAVNALGSRYYYAAEQKITVTVTDANLDPTATCLTYHIQKGDSAETRAVRFHEDTRVTKNGAAYTCVIPILDGEAVSDVQVTAVDYSKRSSTASNTNTYLVDATAPAATMSITGPNLESVYTNASGGIYLKLKNSSRVTGASGQLSGLGEETVTLTITVTDENLQLSDGAPDYKIKNYVTDDRKGGGSFSGSVGVNQKATLTYTQILTVKADSNGYAAFGLTLQDLAGNKAQTIDLQTVNGTSYADYLVKPSPQNPGSLGGTLILDRSRPSSTNDFAPPVITLTENQTPVAKVKNTNGEEVSLYAASTSYAMTVTDPMFQADNSKDAYSGLELVTWTVSDPKNWVTGSASDKPGGEQKRAYTIPVNISGENETNDVTVKIAAVDKAGNTVTYERHLAMDSQRPRVRVSYDNNSVQNERYFKENRLLTLTVEDLNFDATKTTVTTERGVSGWSQSGNTYTAVVGYDVDGDYTLNMAATDRAGNAAIVDYTNHGANAAPQSFTVDKTAPVISVSYDNNAAENGKYYKTYRVANITINEHNFSEAAVVYAGTASLDGNTIQTPKPGGWSSSGDNRSAAISFRQDGDYAFTINYTDPAGNIATAYVQEEFTVDTTAPVIAIGGVTKNTAYRGSLRPTIDLSDVNFDAQGYQVTLTRRDVDGSRSVEYTASETTNAHGLLLCLADLAHELENDGIYTLDVTLRDRAGNQVTDSVTYSLNRFGSSYYTQDEATQKLLSVGYTKTAPELKIMEVNPDALSDHTVSFSVNGATKTLVEGEDYSVEASGRAGEWHQYLYTIFASTFEEDGELLEGDYVVTITSRDAAGNANSNRTNVNELPLSFTIDTTAPAVSITGILDGDRIQEAAREITIYFNDSAEVGRVDIYLNGVLVKTLEGEELAACNGAYTLAVEEGKDVQEIYAVVTDTAGNQTVTETLRFYLNTSAFQQFLHNTPLLSGIGIALLLFALILLLALKRKIP